MLEQSIKDVEYIRRLVQCAIQEEDPQKTLVAVDSELGKLRTNLQAKSTDC